MYGILGADWAKAATVISVAAMVINATKEVFTQKSRDEELEQRVKRLEAHAAQKAQQADVKPGV